MAASLKSLIGKLNDHARRGLEGAAGLCLSRTHFNVEIEHYLLKLLEQTDGDLSRVLDRFGVANSRFTSELSASLDRLKSGNARTPAFSPALVRMLTEAWTIASIDFGADRVRSGFTLLSLAADVELARMMREISQEFQLIDPRVLQREFAKIVSGSKEDVSPSRTEDVERSGEQPPTQQKAPNLDQYTVNLTQDARDGKLDPVLGRDPEIRQMIDILTRRRQNNPILTGEPGVGKTAVVEGFASRVVQGDVPPPLRNVEVRVLDLALLQAGAGIKGEFEDRLKGLIEEVKSSPRPIILFIDEAHTMIGAGGPAGQSDAANLLKPALARGELRTIAATTWSEYKKYFEKDAALTRRFQVVKIDEPDEAQCMVMLRGVASSLEKHHDVRILDDGVAAAVRLSSRYLAGRQLPDKAVSVLDTACARLALGQSTTPPLVEDLTRQVEDLRLQARVLERESAVGSDHAERLDLVRTRIAEAESEMEGLLARYEEEKSLVVQLREVRTKLEESPDGGEGAKHLSESDRKTAREEITRLQGALDDLQGDSPLVRVCVDSHIVGEVISSWSGIPVGRMLKDELTSVLSLESLLQKRLVGQGHALELISQRIRTSRASLDDPSKPIGVFMLVGPSGVGKTETALALAEVLYGGERNLISINMSEFQEAHTVSTLKGSPPGYVGYGEGGVLTEAVRRSPYSVVLLDEAEKAHPDVMNLFYQIFDKGVMEDGEGREIDFRHTVILLASNAASETVMKLCAQSETPPSAVELVKVLKPKLDRIFKPALLGRLVIVPYLPVQDEILKQIITLKMGKIQRRLEENHKISLTYDEALLNEIAARCTEVESGARNVDNILTNTLLPDISRELLGRMAEGDSTSEISVGVGKDGSFVYSYD